MTRNRGTLAVIVLVPVAVALALWAFAWPNARLEPRDLPVGVAGPERAAAPVKDRLGEREGAFDVRSYADESAARAAIEEREVYGAVVVTPQGPKLLTASAASPVVARVLTAAVGSELPGESGRRPMPTEDVVPTPEADPRGVALNSSVLPLALAGVAAGALVTLLGLRGIRAAAALVGAAAAVGLVAAGIAHSWLGLIAGDWWAEAGAFALTALAGGAAVGGLAAVFGTRGIGLGALTVVLLGNPFSGVSSAPQMLPEPVGAIGQLLPPGAGSSLLRSLAYFDGNAAAGPAAVLSAWALAGLALVWLGAVRKGGGGAVAADGETTPRDLRPATATA